MDVSDLRKRILRSLDEARKDAASRREAIDRAAQAWESFRDTIAVPLVRQAAQVLNATGEAFSVHTPASSVRLVSNASAETFLEFELDRGGVRTAVVARTSIARGRSRADVVEQPVAGGKPVDELTESDLSSFLVAEIPKLVIRP